jgi:WXXGXW repeat (2 copies)
MNRTLALLALALIALTGCVTERVVVHERPAPPGPTVYREPPAVVREVVTVAPGPTHVWIDGHYVWRRNDYVWVPGHWAQPPRPRAAWVPGVWLRIGGGWSWREGYWQ